MVKMVIVSAVNTRHWKFVMDDITNVIILLSIRMVANIFVKQRHIHNVRLKHIIKEYSLRRTFKIEKSTMNRKIVVNGKNGKIQKRRHYQRKPRKVV